MFDTKSVPLNISYKSFITSKLPISKIIIVSLNQASKYNKMSLQSTEKNHAYF